MTARTSNPIKWAGGKHYLAERIVQLMPRHLHYVEPYAGGLAVLLARDPNDHRLWASMEAGRSGVSEVVNDIDDNLMHFWKVLRDPKLFADLVRMCEATPLSREVYDEAAGWSKLGRFNTSPVHRAWAFLVHCRQSRAGTFKGFTSITRNRTRRGINGNVSEWLSAIDSLPAVHARLQPVVIECMEATDLIQREDGPDTLFYVDAPYVHDTRTTKDVYTHEMSDGEHRALIDILCGIKGKAMVSMYHHPIYDLLNLKYGWRLVEFDMPNHAAGGKTKRRMTECLWMNYQSSTD